MKFCQDYCHYCCQDCSHDCCHYCCQDSGGYCCQDCCHYYCQDHLQLWQRSTFCPPLLGQGGVGVQLWVLHRERLVLRVILDDAGQDVKMLGGHGQDAKMVKMPRLLIMIITVKTGW